MRIDRIKLVSEMARKDMTLKRLSELTGLSRPTLSGIKSGKTCSSETAGRLSKALGLDLAELLEVQQ